ncbi:hypothetical protein BpHYR1_047335 [Brachionus plicatilis]|uniref:Uncharacterized protein n=1 Tax=Brachionus plicatilis TaxID=10195 RepID=A0A3M7PZ98_BRAPC|nr:hypothetical protein BpHYR1_047335 [Brachionus plicatilis]
MCRHSNLVDINIGFHETNKQQSRDEKKNYFLLTNKAILKPKISLHLLSFLHSYSSKNKIYSNDFQDYLTKFLTITQ